MNYATWSIRNPVPVVVLCVLLVVAGVAGLRQLPIQNLPEIELPEVVVALSRPGAAAAQLETEVARPVEDAIAGVAGLRHVRTRISTGVVWVSAEFDLGKPLPTALAEVKDALDGARARLPPDLLPPSVSADVVGGAPILTYAVGSARMDELALSWFVDEVLERRLRALRGVGRVQRVGGLDREVRIELDPLRLAALDVTAVDVSRALHRVQREASGGQSRLGGGEQTLRTIATVSHAAALEALPLPLPDGRRLVLDQVATVHDQARQRRRAALLDGVPVVGFQVYRMRGMDETDVAAAVERALAELQSTHPDLDITRVASSVDYTAEQYRGSMQMLLEGALLAVLVVWWFLRDWRATAVAAMALPLSVLPTFAVMAWAGFSLNTLTLLALAVVAGVLVDDAIVEVENIERHRRTGKPLRRATADAVTEIAPAVMATTLTLVVVFLPTALMPGVAGLLFAQFGWTAVAAVLASLLVARLVTPLLAVRWLAPTPVHMHRDGPWTRRYLRAVEWCLAHRAATMVATLAFVVASASLLPLLPTGFVPAADRGVVDVSIELPPGVALEASVAMSEQVREALSDMPEIQGMFASAGGAEGGDGRSRDDARRAAMILILVPRGSRPAQAVVEQVVRERLARVPGARLRVGGNQLGGGWSLILASDDARQLAASAQALQRQLRDVPGLANVNSSAGIEQPELVVRPDPHRAAEQGVDTLAIASTLRMALGDGDEADLPRLNLDQRQLLIRVQVPAAVQADPAALARLRVPSAHGTVPLGAIATLALESGPAQIERFDRRRYVTLDASLDGIVLGQADAAVAGLPALRTLPASVSRIDAGDSELASELASGFLNAVLAGVGCMFAVLVLLFKDGFQPVTILAAVPLSLGGALLALWLTGAALDVPAMIGLVMLMGIVTKNSILLVEHATQAMRAGATTRTEAVVAACAQRARPIVMTSVAMVAGMAPIALGFGADASFRQPLAVAVTGGLVTSTLLSLLVVPVAFTLIDDLRRSLRGPRRRRSAPRPARAEAADHAGIPPP